MCKPSVSKVLLQSITNIPDILLSGMYDFATTADPPFDVYYSPNASVVSPPAPHLHIPPKIPRTHDSANPFTPGRTWRDLHSTPHRFSDMYGWMAYIPRVATYLYPFDRIAIVPPPVMLPEGLWALPEQIVNKWDSLSFELIRMVDRMINLYKLRAVAPYSPRGWGYWKKFKSHGKALKLSSLAADWFHVWAGLITYLIRSIEQENPERAPDSKLPPQWDVWMERQGYLRAWIDGWRAMSSNNIPRAGSVWGAFMSEEMTAKRGLRKSPFDSQVYHQVPVWFLWDKESLETWGDTTIEAALCLMPPAYLRSLVLEVGVAALKNQETSTSSTETHAVSPQPERSPWSRECREARHKFIKEVFEALEAKEAGRIA